MLFNFVEYIILASLYVIFSYLYFIFCLFLFLVYHPTLGYGVPFHTRIFIFKVYPSTTKDMAYHLPTGSGVSSHSWGIPSRAIL